MSPLCAMCVPCINVHWLCREIVLRDWLVCMFALSSREICIISALKYWRTSVQSDSCNTNAISSDVKWAHSFYVFFWRLSLADARLGKLRQYACSIPSTLVVKATKGRLESGRAFGRKNVLQYLQWQHSPLWRMGTLSQLSDPCLHGQPGLRRTDIKGWLWRWWWRYVVIYQVVYLVCWFEIILRLLPKWSNE